MLYHLAYGSASREPVAPDLLSDILEVSVRNNLRDGITGILLYHDQSFFQVLEGEKRTVEECFRRIDADGRHVGVLKMWSQQADTRIFSEWAMGYAGPDRMGRIATGAVAPLSEFLDAEVSVTRNDPITLSLARKMYKRFKNSAMLRMPAIPAR